MKKNILIIGFLFCILNTYAQKDYFPIIAGSYWVYDVYEEGIISYQDSVIYNESVEINDTTFHLFIHNYIQDGKVTEQETYFLYNNMTDDNTIMISNRNFGIIDSAIMAKHTYTDGEWWVYERMYENDTIRVDFIDSYSVSSGVYADCFIQGDEYYFAPNVGIIKIKLWNEESYYDLKNYFIPKTSSISINKQKGFDFYPNPTNDYIKFRNIDCGYYQIYDIQGRNIKNGKFIDSQINVTELKVGLYVLILKTNEIIKKARFIKR